MKRTLVLTAMLGILTAGSALALPINDRIGDIIPKASSGSEPTLQAILDSDVNNQNGWTSTSTHYLDAVTSQSKVALWNPSDGSTTSTFLVSLQTAHSNGFLGIYSATTGLEFSLIDHTTPAQTTATFGIFDGDLYLNNNLLQAGFGNTFGFFWNDGTENYKSYTEDTKNTVGTSSVRALTYQLAGGANVKYHVGTNGATYIGNMTGSDDWIMSFEDHPFGDYDYQDATFLVKDISPVPEPGTMMLLGAGFLGLAIYGKRRKNA